MINIEFQFFCVQYFGSARKSTIVGSYFLHDFLTFCPVYLKYKQMRQYEIV